MNNPIVIVGAGRQGRNIAETLENAEATAPVAGFLDDTKPAGSTILGVRVLAGFSAMHDKTFVHDHGWIVAIGDNLVRSELCRALADAGATFVSAVHPTAQLSRTAALGRGVFVGPLCSVGTGSTIGDWAVLEGHTRIGVDVRVAEGAFFGPGVILTGGSSVGARSFLGAGTTLCNDVSVGADCVVGANSLVTRDLPDGATACGTPARPARLNRRPFKR
jgi:sugar O-acyltransferase (sialic acid O-acetyltransferase NeuD family)